MSRPTRYTENKSERDWIDEFCATSSTEEVRGAFRFTIGKYLRRYGKKDDPLQEALKIQDYANRLVAFERELASPEHVELRRHPMTPNVIEPDGPAFAGGCVACGKHGGHGGLQCPKTQPYASSDAADHRMDAIARNGNGGEHYSEIDRLRAAAYFNDDVRGSDKPA
ncbi:hypothetical protein [Leptolyngbya phage Lbo-JY16]